MFNIGGKINESICNNLFSVYDYEYNKWFTCPGPECFRHVTWIFKDKIHIHGGLDDQNMILKKGEVLKFNLLEIFKDYPELTKKIKSFIDIFSQNNSPIGLSPNISPNNSIIANPYTPEN